MKNLIIILILMALIVGVISYVYSAPIIYVLFQIMR